MRTIICGSRDIKNRRLVDYCISTLEYEITTVISGMAKGPDLLGRDWAIDNNIPVEEYPADWSLGKSTGYIRNAQMVECCDAVLAIWDGKSNGTKHTIDLSKKKGKNVTVFIYEQTKS